VGRLREYILEQASGEHDDAASAAAKVLSFKRPLSPEKNFVKGPGATAFALINQAAERIANIDEHAAERQAQADALVKQAIERLKIAHLKVQSADRFKTECTIKIQDADKLLKRASSYIAAMEKELYIAKQRAKALEIRASEAENALMLLEEALRTRILERIPEPSSAYDVAS